MTHDASPGRPERGTVAHKGGTAMKRDAYMTSRMEWRREYRRCAKNWAARYPECDRAYRALIAECRGLVKARIEVYRAM